MKLLVTLFALAIAAWPYSVELAWTDRNPPGATVVFHIYKAPLIRNRCPADSQFVRIVSTVAPSYRDSNVQNGAGYCFKVSAVTSVESPLSTVLIMQIPKKRWFFF